MIDEFKTLVQSEPEQISLTGHGLEDYYNYVGLTVGNAMSSCAVVDKLSSDIKSHLECIDVDSEHTEDILRLLKDGLVYDSVLNRKDNTEFLQIISKFSLPGKVLKPLTETFSWRMAIRAAKDQIFLSNRFSFNTHSGEDDDEPEINLLEKLREDHPRQVDVANAALALRDLGCIVSLNGHTIKFDGLEKVIELIERTVKEIGGIKLMRAIFTKLVNERVYIPEFNRYVIARNMGVVPFHVTPLTPYGYLLNLAVKYPKENQVLKTDGDKIAKLISIATELSTVLNIQSYTKFDNINFQSFGFAEYIRNLALFDTIFTFPSANLEDIIDITENVFNWVHEASFENQYGFTIKNIIQVIRCIDDISANNGPQFIFLSSILKKTRHLPQDTVRNVLTKMSHEYGAANVEFSKMSDYSLIDFGFKPLIKITDTKFLLCDKSWCAAGFYEVIATLVRDPNPKKDQSNNQIGIATEKFVYKKLKEKNITFSNGNYVDGTIPAGEVDVLVESVDCINLIEIKKKSLTRISRSGNEIKIITDLAQSLFDAQIQAGRTEILLRQEGSIALSDEQSNVNTINLNGRNIERIALTQWDYGSFQDRMVINKILTMLIKNKIETIDSESAEAKTIEKIIAKQKKWNEQAQTLSILDTTFHHFPFFNCWFLSLPQLLLILKYSEDNESFQQRLSSTKHISYSTNNFYLEFWQAVKRYS